MSRRKRIALIAIGVLLFLAISFQLARFLSVENVERDDIVAVLQAQADGKVPAMLGQLSGCSESAVCVAQVHANAARLHRPGAVKILTLTSATAYALTGATGLTRVAWTIIGRLPVVQCVRVRRTGNFIKGIDVSLLELTAPINNEADC